MDIEKKVETLEKLLNSVIEDNQSIKSTIAAGFEKINNNFAQIDKVINILVEKIDKVDKKVELLSGDTGKNFNDVNLHLENISTEIAKISTVTRYEEDFNNLTIVQGGKKS